ncbi:leukocyte immunoglobulin-like receptor subfamily A member 5 [Macrotis lagotis]|uniref:leukocyte immunoglobulin-like receptor subfamily A member 5 n=1 Tax=Macrotis lagotis TaxID=92651 RepID=UPI003D6896F1
MTPILSALLSLGLCLDQRMRAQADKSLRPSLRAENDSLVPEGRSVTLRCRGSWGADVYLLEKKQRSETIKVKEVTSNETEVEFPILTMTEEDAGIYYCLFRHSSLWSERSDPLELVVTGLYDPPSLSALPSSLVLSGQEVTLQCQSELWYDRSALYKNGEKLYQVMAYPHEGRTQATFHIPAVTSAHGANYCCYTFLSDSPYGWSFPSDPLLLRVTDPAPQDYTVGNLVRLSMAGLVLILLGVLLAEAWQSQRGP